MKIIPINSARRQGTTRRAPLQASEANQYSRRAWIRQFVLGSSVLTVAKRERVRCAEIERELRLALWTEPRRAA